MLAVAEEKRARCFTEEIWTRAARRAVAFPPSTHATLPPRSIPLYALRCLAIHPSAAHALSLIIPVFP